MAGVIPAIMLGMVAFTAISTGAITYAGVKLNEKRKKKVVKHKVIRGKRYVR